jgi:cytochrome oxidase assembly protein ShyY1
MTTQLIDNSSKDPRTVAIKSGVAIKRVCLLLAVLLLPVLIGLGVWQLQRADQKARIIDQAQSDLLQQLPVSADPQALPQAVEIEARLVGDRQLLLDNRTRNGRVGYELLVLFQDLASGQWGIANLGWLAAAVDRSQLPNLPLFDDTVRLTGMLVSAQAGYQLGVDHWQSGWPKRIQQPDLARFEALFGRTLYPAILRLSEPVKLPGLAGLDSRWQLVNMLPQQHLGYAVQWFAMALALLLWLGWFGWWRNRSDGRASADRPVRLQPSQAPR